MEVYIPSGALWNGITAQKKERIWFLCPPSPRQLSYLKKCSLQILLYNTVILPRCRNHVHQEVGQGGLIGAGQTVTLAQMACRMSQIFSSLKRFIFNLYMGILLGCISSLHVCRPEDGIGPPGTGVTDGCQLLCVGWALNLGLLTDQPVLLTPEQSLQIQLFKI